MPSSASIPRVSVGLPVYNGATYLRQAMDSVLAQSLSDLELIVSDNGSTDETERICREYASLDSRVCYYRSEINRGASWNFNHVVAGSRGRYFKWMAADDEIAPQFLARCVEPLDRDGNVVLVHPRAVIIDESGNEIGPGTFKYDLVDLCSRSPSERIRQMFLYGSVYPIFGLIRSAALKNTPLLRPYVGADHCLLFDLLLRGKFAYVPEFLMRLRAHPDGYSCRLTKALQRGSVDWERQDMWWGPQGHRSGVMPYWRRLREHFLSAARSETSFRQKVRTLALLCRVANWWRGQLAKELLSGPA